MGRNGDGVGTKQGRGGCRKGERVEGRNEREGKMCRGRGGKSPNCVRQECAGLSPRPGGLLALND